MIKNLVLIERDEGVARTSTRYRKEIKRNEMTVITKEMHTDQGSTL